MGYRDLSFLLQNGTPPLTKCSVKLKMYDGSILKGIRETTTKAEHRGKQHSLKFQVVKSKNKPLLTAVSRILWSNRSTSVRFEPYTRDTHSKLFRDNLPHRIQRLKQLQRLVMRCFSEWRTIPDKQRKIYLARLGFEPATFGLLVRCSTNWATGQVGSWSSNDGTWAIWYFETKSSFFHI